MQLRGRPNERVPRIGRGGSGLNGRHLPGRKFQMAVVMIDPQSNSSTDYYPSYLKTHLPPTELATTRVPTGGIMLPTLSAYTTCVVSAV